MATAAYTGQSKNTAAGLVSALAADPTFCIAVAACGGGAAGPTTNSLVATSASITSTVNGVTSTVVPSAGVIQDKLGFNAAGDLVIAVDRDRRNGTTSRGDSIQGVSPTALEHPSPVSGDTRTIILVNNTVEYWTYVGIAWGLTATVLPANIDGSHAPVSRADAVAGVAPTASEVSSPVNGDSASVYLADGVTEHWFYTTVWVLIKTISPLGKDGRVKWVVRGDTVTGNGPTGVEFPTPIDGDTSIVILNNGVKEYWSYVASAWTLTTTEAAGARDGHTAWVVRTNSVSYNAPTALEFPSPADGDTAIVILLNGDEEFWTYTTLWVRTHGLPYSANNIFESNRAQNADRIHLINGWDHTWNDIGNLTMNVVDGASITNVTDSVTSAYAQSNISTDSHNLLVVNASSQSSALTITPTLSKLEVNGGGLNRASYHIEDGTVGEAVGDPQLFLKTNAVSNGTAVAGQVLTLSAVTGESEFAPAPSDVDTIQTAATNGNTTIAAWGSVVLIPTLTGDITLTYPTPLGHFGKTIKIVRTGTPNGFTVTHTPSNGFITLTNAAGELASAGGAFEIEAIDGTNIRQVSNSVADPTVTTLGIYSVTRIRNTIGAQLFTTTSETPVDLSASTININTGLFSPDLATGTVTVGTAGNYHITFTAQADDLGGTASALQCYVRVNGVAKGNSSATATDTYEINTSISTTVPIPAGGIVTLTALTSDGEDIKLTGYDLSIIQMPAAVAPVINTVAEYASNTLVATNSDANLDVGNWVDHNGLTINLPNAGTYRVFWRASGELADGGTTEVVMSGRIRNVTNSTIYPTSRAIIVGYDSPTASLSTRMGTGSGEALVTVTAQNTITFQTRMSALASSSAIILGDGNLRGTAYLSYEKIAGQLPADTFVGATGVMAGATGFVPAPAATDNVKFLKGDGTFSDVVPAASSITTAMLVDNAVTTAKITDANITTVKIADNGVTVAKLPAGATATSYLRGDGVWVAPVTRVVVEANNTSGQSIPNGATTAITGWSELKDTLNAFNVSTGVFVAPRTAEYMISLTVGYNGFTSSANGSLSAEISGAISRGVYLPVTNAAVIDSISPTLTVLVALAASQAITIQSFQNTGAARTLNAGTNRCHLSIMEVTPTY